MAIYPDILRSSNSNNVGGWMRSSYTWVVNLSIEVSNLDSREFSERVGPLAALRVFGQELVNLLDELNETLAM